MTFPQPHRERWQPLRAGLVDLFYYDQEEFRFRDGRLLLRGNNGTGKSKVLALMLPFLLDGELAPHRVEPDADPKKRMDWNLLLGGAHPHPERLGYTWIEFGRRREDGTADYRTLGCGLKAVSGRGIARHWYFVSTRRVGVDLRLVDATSTALSRDRLGEELGDRGMVYDRARDYRRAVDEALFGLGEQRYAALVDLLINLRAPQLSKRPSEKALSSALTESLPPLDQAVLADVAEAFRSLEEDRDSLAAMTEAHRAAESFLGHYRRYARVASRRRAALPRKAQSAYEKVNSDLAAARADLDEAQSELLDSETRLAELTDAEVRLRAADEALRRSPDMDKAAELRRAAAEAERTGKDAERLTRERQQAEQLADKRSRKAHSTADRLAQAEQSSQTARLTTLDAARSALIAEAHADLTDDQLSTGNLLADRQDRSVTHVTRLRGLSDQAQRELAGLRQRHDELAAEADALTDRRQRAADAVRDRGADLTAAVRRYLQDAVELTITDPAAVLAALELWCETLSGDNPARRAVEDDGRAAAGRLAHADAAVAAEAKTAALRESELVAEIARLEAGEDTAPPPPATRAPDVRTGRPGAPLWQLVDFRDAVSEVDRAGVEAALEAAGILDAWVAPDGRLLAPDSGDVFLVGSPGTTSTTTLATFLRPAVDRADEFAAAVPDHVLTALLAGIGVGAGATRVGPDGSFRNGVLAGSAHKPKAVYIGRGAREAARRALLAKRTDELRSVRAELSALTRAREDLARRQERLAQEIRTCPTDTALRDAHATVAALADEHARLQERTRLLDVKLAQAAEQARERADELAEAGAELGLPTDEDGLTAVANGLARYRTELAALVLQVGRRAELDREAQEAQDELVAAQEELFTRAELADQALLDATAARERHRTLADTVGSAVAELERRLAEVVQGLETCANDRKATETRRTKALTGCGRAEGQVQLLEERLATVIGERSDAAEAMRRFAATGLLTVALPELVLPDQAESWAPDPTVRLARQVERELAEVADEDGVWDRVQRKVTDELKTLADTLSRHANTASARLLDDGIVVDVVFQGRATTAPELAASLGVEVAERQRLLDEREREILENHLVNEVASTLQELISAAEAQVAGMNAELADRPTSTGMKLRLVWLPVEDGPVGLAAARERLLRQTSDAWSEADRSAVGAFLQAQIAHVRSRDTTGTWLDHLTVALDYRSWHRFAIQRHQNGQWRTATGPASGGERVLTASVPLFAAASSHYASAGNPHAPRLVALDEAFAGVDDDSRAKCLGLLAAFDLDVVMTSEREWGCYPEVPGLAIAQLSRTDEVAAVLVTPWEWDGRRRTRVSP